MGLTFEGSHDIGPYLWRSNKRRMSPLIFSGNERKEYAVLRSLCAVQTIRELEEEEEAEEEDEEHGSVEEARGRLAVRLLPFHGGGGAALRRPDLSAWNLLPQIVGGTQKLVQRRVRWLPDGREARILRRPRLGGGLVPVASLSPQPLRHRRRRWLVPDHLLDLWSLYSHFHGASSSRPFFYQIESSIHLDD